MQTTEVQEVLAQNRDRFLAFLKNRVSDPATAQDLQRDGIDVKNPPRADGSAAVRNG